MKIAYLMLAHKDIDFVERVAQKLTKGNLNHIFIHIDKKSSIVPPPINKSNTLFRK